MKRGDEKVGVYNPDGRDVITKRVFRNGCLEADWSWVTLRMPPDGRDVIVKTVILEWILDACGVSGESMDS